MLRACCAALLRRLPFKDKFASFVLVLWDNLQLAPAHFDIHYSLVGNLAHDCLCAV